MRNPILVVSLASLLVVGCQHQLSGSSSQPANGSPGAQTVQPAVAGSSRPGAAQTPSQPAWRDVTIPAGTRLSVRLEQTIASDASRPDDPVTATLVDPIVVDNVTVVPAGSVVGGVVNRGQAIRAGERSGRGDRALRLAAGDR